MTNTFAQVKTEQISFWRRLDLRKEDAVLLCIFLVLVGLYVQLLLTDTVALGGYGVLGLLALVYFVAGGKPLPPTPLIFPLIALAAMLSFSTFISTDPGASLPKLHSVLLSFLLFFVIASAIRNKARLQVAIGALIALCVATLFVGLVAADWSGSGFPLFQRIPRLIGSIPGAAYGEGINQNTIGAVLCLFIPAMLSLLFTCGAQQTKTSGSVLAGRLYKLGLLILSIALLLTLLAAGSRSALLGCAVGLLLLLFLKDKRWLWLLPFFAILGGVAVWLYARGAWPQLTAMLASGENPYLAGRLIIWRDALVLVQDFPITGSGLGSFNQVFSKFYTYTIFLYGDGPIFHAHNTLLSTAVDVGIPGLVLFIGLLSSFSAMALRTYKRVNAGTRAVVLGLLCGVVAHQVFGLTDAFPLGKKLGVIMWIYFAVVTAIYVHHEHFAAERSHNRRSSRQRFGLQRARSFVLGSLLWLLSSLAALGWVSTRPLLALLIATVGGISFILLIPRQSEPLPSGQSQ